MKVINTLQRTRTENKFLNSLVQDCITYRLDENEAIEYIETRFKKISLSAYKHRKARVLSDNHTQIWLDYFTRVGFISNHKKQMDYIQMIQNDSMHQLFIEQNNEPRNEGIILRVKQDIRDNAMMLSQFNLGTPIISALKAKLESKDRGHIINDTTALPTTYQDISD